MKNRGMNYFSQQNLGEKDLAEEYSKQVSGKRNMFSGITSTTSNLIPSQIMYSSSKSKKGVPKNVPPLNLNHNSVERFQGGFQEIGG